MHTNCLVLSVMLCGAVVLPAAGKESPDAIHAVLYSHEDLGYGNYPHVLRAENRLENLYRSIQYCDQTANWPLSSQYRYQQEGAEPLLLFLSNCTPQDREKLARYMKEGRICVSASHTTILTDRLNPESAARFFYLGCRFLPDLLGTPPGKVVAINDVTGVTWSLPIYCEAAQVPFAWNGHNTCGRCDELESAPIVRWIGPGGTGSVLTASIQYAKGMLKNPKLDLPSAVAKTAKQITPHYIPLWQQGHDFSIADLNMAEAAKKWNDGNGKPPVMISTYEMYLSALAKRQTPAKTPTVNKTGPCQWMDQPISDAWLFGRVRQAAERLPIAEKFSSIAMASIGSDYPWFDITVGWHNLLCNYEHTIGAACWRCKDAEGWRHYETEAVEHRQEGLLARETADRTLDDALGRICGRIGARHANAIAVFNPLAQTRTDIVTFQPPATLRGTSLAAVDDVNETYAPCQWLDDTTLVFTAEDVPALGYRTFHLVEQVPLLAKSSPLSAETKFYRITLDPKIGSVSSLFDKELNRELIKKDAPHGFGQYLYQWIQNPQKREFLWSKPPVAASITITDGPVAAIVHIRATAKGVNSLDQTITLYHSIKRVDFALAMDKQPSGRSLADYYANNLRGKESIFVALPFDIPDFKAVYQTAGGGVAQPIGDQFNGTGTAFHAVQHFTDISNDKFGVTVSPLDFALVEFEHPRSDPLSRVVKGSEAVYEKKMVYPTTSSLYLYLMDNMFTTNIRVDQRGQHLFRWSLRSHAGDWQTGQADQFGQAVNQTLQARFVFPAQPAVPILPAGAHSFASVNVPNVSISTCKLAEFNGDGFIIRLVETQGRKTDFTLRLPFLAPIASVVQTNLVESDLPQMNNLKVGGDSLRLELPPFGVKTLRVRGSAQPCTTVANLSVKAIADMEVALQWDAVPDAAFYRVYRGTSADFAPSSLTLIAMPADPHFTDKARDYANGWITNRLHPQTNYYYHVQPVNRRNQRGPASAAVAVTTPSTARQASVPQPVRDLHAILVSPIAPANQVNLLWRSNVEPNIAAYEVHRSTMSGFIPSPATLLAKVPLQRSTKATGISSLTHQMFLDAKPALATTYCYKVRAITTTGLCGAFSNEAAVTTKTQIGPAVRIHAPGQELMGQDKKTE